MRRLILTLAAAFALAAPLAAGDAAAQGRGRGNGRNEQAERGWERQRGAQRNYDRGNAGGRNWQRQERGYAPAPRYVEPPAPYGYGPPRSYGARRGGFLPPDYRGAMIYDYGRYRLRPPPPGYAWYRVGDDYLLVSLLNGLIFDVISP